MPLVEGMEMAKALRRGNFMRSTVCELRPRLQNRMPCRVVFMQRCINQGPVISSKAVSFYRDKTCDLEADLPSEACLDQPSSTVNSKFKALLCRFARG
jgi:hypothetical protein